MKKKKLNKQTNRKHCKRKEKPLKCEKPSITRLNK